MNALTAILIFVATCMMFASSAFAIQCWDCSSHINPGCGEPFRNDSFAKIDCDQIIMPHLEGQKATLCRKIIQKVQGSNTARVIRGCGWIVDDSVNKDCVRRSGTFSVLMEYCTCDHDGCNAATSLTVRTIFTLITLIACVWVTFV